MISKSNNILKFLLGDIRFWIVLFFILRLYNINSPIFDSHNWRQSDGYAIARNFFEIDANILFPRIDHAGNKTGIMGSEFPIMNYVVYLLYTIFDVDWWQGRILNLLVSSLGCYFFYKTIKQFIKKEAAFPATIILIASLWFSHSRKFMPDVFSTSLVLIGVYFGWSFLRKNKNWHVLIYFLFITFGLLSKLPAFVMTALLIPAAFDPSILLKRKLVFIGISILSILPSLWWYFYWAPKLTLDYGYYYFFMGSDINTSIGFLLTEWQNTLSRFYKDAIGFFGFGVYLIGIVYTFYKKEKKLLIILSSAVIFQFIFMLKGGETFAHHTYYIISFAPAMALFAAFFISSLEIKWLRILLMLAIVVEGVLNLQHDFMPKPSENYRLKLETVADEYSVKSDLIAINNEANPASLYFAHRKGWTVGNSIVSNSQLLQDIKNKGCKLFIWDKHRAAKPNELPFFNLVAETEDFAIFQPE